MSAIHIACCAKKIAPPGCQCGNPAPIPPAPRGLTNFSTKRSCSPRCCMMNQVRSSLGLRSTLETASSLKPAPLYLAYLEGLVDAMQGIRVARAGAGGGTVVDDAIDAAGLERFEQRPRDPGAIVPAPDHVVIVHVDDNRVREGPARRAGRSSPGWSKGFCNSTALASPGCFSRALQASSACFERGRKWRVFRVKILHPALLSAPASPSCSLSFFTGQRLSFRARFRKKAKT